MYLRLPLLTTARHMVGIAGTFWLSDEEDARKELKVTLEHIARQHDVPALTNVSEWGSLPAAVW